MPDDLLPMPSLDDDSLHDGLDALDAEVDAVLFGFVEAAPGMTKEQLRNLTFTHPAGGSSMSPKQAFDLREHPGEFETLADLAAQKDSWRLDDALGKGYTTVSPTLSLKADIQAGRPITVYRAVPTDEPGIVPGILPGAYVTQSKAYAQVHGNANIPGRFRVEQMSVYPDEMMTLGDPHEFVYLPRDVDTAHARLHGAPSPKQKGSGGGGGDQPRVPAGRPEGGQFAPKGGAKESDVLDDFDAEVDAALEESGAEGEAPRPLPEGRAVLLADLLAEEPAPGERPANAALPADTWVPLALREADDQLARDVGALTGSDVGPMDPPWAPVPTWVARQFQQTRPDAAIDVVFPTVYEEDRSAKIRDLGTSQALGAITHQRMSEQIAKEIGVEDYDYDAEQAAIREERAELPPEEFGAAGQMFGGKGGAGAPAAGGGMGARSAPGIASEAPAVKRADLSGDATVDFKRDMRQAEADDDDA